MLCSGEVFRYPDRRSSLLGLNSGRAYVVEYLKSSWLREHTHIEGLKVIVVFQLIFPLLSQPHVLSQHSPHWELLLVENIELRMKELAPISVGAIGCRMKLVTNFGLEVTWQMYLLD